MKKKSISSLFLKPFLCLTGILTFIFGGCSSTSARDYDGIHNHQLLKAPNSDSSATPLTYHYIVYKYPKDNITEFQLQYDNLPSDKKLFIIAKDKYKSKIITQQFLESNSNGTYNTRFKLPYYCDTCDIDVYLQNVSDPDFTISEHVGSAESYLPNIVELKRDKEGQETKIEAVDGSTVIKEGRFISRLTPNYYTIRLTTNEHRTERFGKIILPEGQDKLLTDKAKIVPASVLHHDNGGEIDDNFDFYIPREVKKFKFVIYNKEPETAIGQFNIELNRQ